MLLHPNRYNFQVYVRLYYIDTESNATIYAPFIAGMRTRSPAFSFSVPVGDSFSGVTNEQSAFAYKIQVSLGSSFTSRVFLEKLHLLRSRRASWGRGVDRPSGGWVQDRYWTVPGIRLNRMPRFRAFRFLGIAAMDAMGG